MPKLTHYPWIRRLLGKGINKDIAPELLPDGLARDAFHVRPTSSVGATGAIEAVGGEEILYDIQVPGQSTYKCIGDEQVNNRVVHFWASPDPQYPPYITIDGIVSAQSSAIPYVFDRPLKIATEARCRGGILYPVDGQAPALYWDIEDMLEQAQLGTQLYFSEYVQSFNSVALSVPAEFPVFDGFASGLDGLPVGQYLYCLRYVSPAGDRTNRGPETSLISVPRYQDFDYTTIYPGGRTEGGTPDPAVNTQYGIRLRWRIDNTQGYESVEVCRMRINDGQGLSSAGIYEVVARIPLTPNQFNILTYTDPGEWTLSPPEVIPPDEAADQLVFPLNPNAVEIADNRLLYANTNSTPQVIPLTFATNSNGDTVVPITQRLTTVVDGVEYNSGHNDPYNLANYRSFSRGERYSFAVVPWDGNSAKQPAVPIPGAQDYQFPNRRDVKGPLGPYGLDSLDYSSDSAHAANTQCQSTEPVSPTFEVVTQGSRARNTPAQTFNVRTLPGQPFNPIRPIGTEDVNTTTEGWEFRPVRARYLLPTAPINTADQGAIFTQRHHALGLFIKGIGNIPDNIKALTIARSEPAGRVIARGFGFWDLRNGTPGEAFIAQRSSNVLRCHFPEIDAALIEQSVIEDMQANPGNYRMQINAGYGFFQDVYGYGNLNISLPGGGAINLENNAVAADMLLYASVQNDPTGQVNVYTPSDAWQTGPNTTTPPGNGYVGHYKWRNPTFFGQESQMPCMTSPDQGNFGYTITNFSRVAEGRGSYWRLQTNEFIYIPGTQTIGQAVNVNGPEIRGMHQPVYSISIIKVSATVEQSTVPLYANTSTTLKMKSTVGIMPAAAQQQVDFELLGERYEDVCTYVFGSSADDLRYVYVKEAGQPERAWVNVTNIDASVVDPSVVLADISANGFWLAPDGTQVYGIYQTISPFARASSGSQTFIRFANSGVGTMPPANARIIVKFNGKNIRVFGGDSVISRQVYSPYDQPVTLDSNANAGIVNIPPMPMWGFSRTIGYTLVPGMQSFDQWRVQTARQIAVMWDAEIRLNSPMDVFLPQIGMNHPRTMYIIRPYQNVSTVSGVANGFFPQYDALYTSLLGFNVASEFFHGGICYRQEDAQPNLDYSKQPNLTFAGLPEVGFDDPVDQCTAIYASNEYLVGSQDTPGFRTFLSSNIKFLSTEHGPINQIAFALSGGATNIYAWTERGVCKVLYNKSILTGASGEQISTQQISNLWGEEIWLTRNIGLPDQMYRWFVRGFAPTGQGYADSFFWMDRKGAYRMTGDTIIDISRDRILSDLAPTLLNFPSDFGSTATALYNVKDDEVWFYIDAQTLPPDPPVIPTPVNIPDRLFVYNTRLGEWVGKFDFRFDNFVMKDREILGARQGQVYLLDKGDIVNGLPRTASIIVPFFGDIGKFKQHLRWRISGLGDKATYKPDEIRIYDSGQRLLCIQNFSIAQAANPAAAQNWVLYYDGWEQHTACILASVDPLRRPPQSEGFFVELIWNTGGYKNCLAVSSQLQPIR